METSEESGMIYSLREYDGLRRMIYLALLGMISYPFPHMPKAYIIREAGYHIEDISPVPRGTDIIAKRAFVKRQMLFLHGAPDRIRTRDLQNRNLSLYPAELPEHDIKREE